MNLHSEQIEISNQQAKTLLHSIMKSIYINAKLRHEVNDDKKYFFIIKWALNDASLESASSLRWLNSWGVLSVTINKSRPPRAEIRAEPLTKNRFRSRDPKVSFS